MLSKVEEQSISLLNELENFLNSEEQNALGINENSNTISSREEANYFIKKVKDLQAEIVEIQDTAKYEKQLQFDRISAWENSKVSGLQYLVDMYVSMLRDFWVANGNDKTMKLSHGSLAMRKIKDKTEIDEEKAIQFFSEHNVLDQFTSRSLNKSLMREHLSREQDQHFLSLDDGSTLDFSNCITIIPQESKFEVK